MILKVDIEAPIRFHGEIDITEEQLKNLRLLRDSINHKEGGLTTRVQKYLKEIMDDSDFYEADFKVIETLRDTGLTFNDTELNSVIVSWDDKEEEIL